ncbi:MAG: hypothetical protein IT431_08980 [Phycisphaerales bacterium]|nr:hypothetical protein [Phycisphaerales bacterium]
MNSTTHSCLAISLIAGAALAGGTDALERELLADAGARTSFQAGATAGHDGKFFLASADGAYRLNVTGQVQFRYNLNSRDTTAPDEDLSNGFSARRTKLGFEGVVADEFDFKIVGAFDRDGGAFELEDAILSREFDNGIQLTWGQFKSPFMREESTSSSVQLAADRSAMNEVFNQDRTQGVQLGYEGDQFRVMGMVSDGFKTPNTPYYATAESDVALTGRVELKLGDAAWKIHKDFTSFREGATGALIGAALHWQTMGETANTDSFGGTAPTDADMVSYTIDAGYEGGGWNLFGAFVGRNSDTSGGPDYDDFGAMLQGGVFLTDRWELFGRWDAVFPDDSRSAGEDFHTLTVGANHYFFPGSHAAKFTADMQWFLDDQAGSGSIVRVNEGIGLAPTSEDDQLSFRLQMQLLF